MARPLRSLIPLAMLVAAPTGALAGPITAPGVQVSPQVAAAPGDGPLVLAATDHVSGRPVTRLWRSLNRGATWQAVSTPPVVEPPTTTDRVSVRGTPSVAFGDARADLAFEASEVASGEERPCRAGSGVYRATSTDGGATFGGAVQVAGNTSDKVRGRSSIVDPGYPGYDAALTAVETRPCSGSGPTEVELYYDFFGLSLTITPIPNASLPNLAVGPGGVYLAYLAGGGTTSKIEVRRCSRNAADFSVSCVPTGHTAAFTAVGALPRGGPSIDSAPDLAVDGDGTLHLTWTAGAAGHTDVLYSRSADGGVTWAAPHPVPGPEPGGDEFLPAVAVSPNRDAVGRLRADVTFLARRPAQADAQPFQASTNGATWGATTVLVGAAAAAPPVVGGVATFGARIDAVSTGPVGPDDGVRGGRGAAVLPRGSDVSFDAQPHGSRPPLLSGVGGALVTGKNAAVPVAPPAVTDADGDPVTLTSTAAVGEVAGEVYRPRSGYAGADAVRFTASDGYTGAASAEQPVTVSNATPVVLIDARARSLVEGSSTRIGLVASDADPGDALTWSLTSVPSSLAGRVTVTAAGELAVDLPPGLRSVSPLPIGVQVSDTTPQVGGTALGTVYVKVLPAYGPVDVTVTTRSTGQTVQFSSVLQDADLEAAALAVRPAPRYLWIFGEGATPRTSSLPNPRVRFAPGVVAAAYTLTVTVPRTEGESVTPSASGRVALRPDGRSLLSVDQRVDRRRNRLVVSLRGRAAGTVQVALRIRGRRPLARRTRVTAGPSRTLGRRVDVSFDLRGVRAGTADLVVTYADGLAGPSPTAVRRKLRLR